MKTKAFSSLYDKIYTYINYVIKNIYIYILIKYNIYILNEMKHIL